MKITYLENSGFIVEYEETVLVFDYYMGQLPRLGDDREIYVFASHAHYDHFNKEIFAWGKSYQDITYILSDDIKEAGPDGRTVVMGIREERTVGSLKIRTLRSTDEGVAFLVRFKDQVIYHAGDLNWWHWEGESPIFNEMMRRKYQYEIGTIEGEAIDIAFVPLDLRQEAQYFLGMDYFMKHTRTKRVFPMHMWGRYEAYDRLMQEPQAAEYRERVMQVREPQQVFEIEESKEEEQTR